MIIFGIMILKDSSACICKAKLNFKNRFAEPRKFIIAVFMELNVILTTRNTLNYIFKANGPVLISPKNDFYDYIRGSHRNTASYILKAHGPASIFLKNRRVEP